MYLYTNIYTCIYIHTYVYIFICSISRTGRVITYISPVNAHFRGEYSYGGNPCKRSGGVMSSLQACFCLCDTEYAECSCPNFDSCSKCQCECLPKPAAKKKRSDLLMKDPERFKYIQQRF